MTTTEKTAAALTNEIELAAASMILQGWKPACAAIELRQYYPQVSHAELRATVAGVR